MGTESNERAAFGLEWNFLALGFETDRAEQRIGVIWMNHNRRVAHLLALVLLPLRRPFLFLANLCAELGVLFERLSLLLVKAEGYFLKREKARIQLRH